MVTGMYSYETYASYKSKSGQGQSKPRSNVGYFKLVDDGDEAIVRFDYDSPSELVMAHVHDEPVGNNKHRRVLCLRENARDDMAKCPLCSRGDKYFAKVYLKLIEYAKDEHGKVVAQAKVWERPESFADEIVEYINNYGGIKDVVFKIKRKGARGSMDTNYILTPMPSTIYNEANGYAKDFSEFENFYLYPHSFMSKTKEEIEEYIATGEFPYRNKDGAKPQGDEGSKPMAAVPSSQTAQDASSTPLQGAHADAFEAHMEEDGAQQANVAPSAPTQATQPSIQRPAQQQPDANNPFSDRPRRRYDYN